MMPLFLCIFRFSRIEHTCIFIQSHSNNTFIYRHSPRLLSIASSLVNSVRKIGNLPILPRREMNSGFLYSKPTNYKLSFTAPF